MRAAPTEKERGADLEYKQSQTAYMKAFANSKEYNTAFSEESLQAHITQAMSTPQGYRKLSEMSDTERKDWARRDMMMSGGTPNIATGDLGATGTGGYVNLGVFSQ
jgi:hypothetical protein